jgi:hypothetical protein
MKNFALIGATGRIAPRRMKANKATRQRPVAALDPNDWIGFIVGFAEEAGSLSTTSSRTLHAHSIARCSPTQRTPARRTKYPTSVTTARPGCSMALMRSRNRCKGRQSGSIYRCSRATCQRRLRLCRCRPRRPGLCRGRRCGKGYAGSWPGICSTTVRRRANCTLCARR